MTDKGVPVEQLLAQMGREMHLAEPTIEREERRARVVGRLRELHGRVLDERGRAYRKRRVTIGLMAAALLAMAGSALAVAAGVAPFASVLPGAEAGAGAPGKVQARPVPRSLERKTLPAPVVTVNETPAPASASPVSASSRPLSSEARRAPVSAELPSQKPGELSAVNRLFADAKQARREHRDAEALSLLEQLLAKYPHSVLAHEASIERFRALARLGRTADAKRHAAAHLARYPGGYAEAEAKRIVGSSETP